MTFWQKLLGHETHAIPLKLATEATPYVRKQSLTLYTDMRLSPVAPVSMA